MANQSNHTLSKAIVSFLPFSKSLNVKEFKEVKGKGICGTINGQEIILGSPGFINGKISKNQLLMEGMFTLKVKSWSLWMFHYKKSEPA